MKISPDGEYVAFLSPKEDMMCVVIMGLVNQEVNVLRGSRADDVHSVHWASNERIVFNLSKHNTYAAGLYANKRGSNRTELLNGTEVVSVVDPLPNDPDYILAWVQVAHYGKERLLKYNIKTGRIKSPVPESKFKGNVFRWYAEPDGSLFGVAVYRDSDLDFLFLDEAGENWVKLDEPEGFTGHEFKVLHADAEKRQLLLCGYVNGENTASLIPFDMETRKLGEPLFRDERYDMMDGLSLVHCDVKGGVVGLRYATRHREIVWFDEEYRRIQSIIDASFRDTINHIVDVDHSMNRLVVYSYSDREPGKYSIVDIGKSAMLLSFDALRDLPSVSMAKQLSLKLKGHDSLELEGFVTLPGPSDEGPYPFIVLPHGGPWARDIWGFDPQVQFLVNRGYGVLQLNFRGSSGYTTEISIDHEGDFRGMVEDVVYATKQLVKNGVADPECIGIMGASFGGYVAALAPVLEPDLFRCSIAMAGVFDLPKQIDNWKKRYWRERMGTYGYDRWIDVLGNPKLNEVYLESISPQYHADKINIPVMLIHGRSDEVVAASQSKRFAKALSVAGNKPETHYFNWESHGLASWKNRIKAYRAIEEFLEEHLPVDIEN
ncbi:MAG: prolyl oligopeptidase family serine peptidase [Verrucomicrobiota bacterium]